ncbi:unnamed protein product, partial [Trypanosoma congolense IL3000]
MSRAWSCAYSGPRGVCITYHYFPPSLLLPLLFLVRFSFFYLLLLFINLFYSCFFFVQVGVPRVGLDIFPGRSVLRSVMAPHSEVKVIDRSAGETEPGTPCRTQFRHADYESDRRSIAMWRQAQLNNIIMKEEQDAIVSRADHRNMVKQLLYVAYNYDPHNRSNAAKWHALMQADGDEFDAADSTYPLRRP